MIRKEVLVVLQDEQRCLSSGDGSQPIYSKHIVHHLQVRHDELAVPFPTSLDQIIVPLCSSLNLARFSFVFIKAFHPNNNILCKSK